MSDIIGIFFKREYMTSDTSLDWEFKEEFTAILAVSFGFKIDEKSIIIFLQKVAM